MDEVRQLQEKLNEIKQYEAEQRNFFMTQRASDFLTEDELKMYKMLNINLSSVIVNEQNENDDLERLLREEYEDDDEDEIVLQEDPEPIDDSDLENFNNEQDVSPRKEYNNELIENVKIPPNKNIKVSTSSNVNEDDKPVVKRPFLKRGTGLTKKFRKAPDAFNYKKLPRYSYIDRVKKTLAKEKNVQLKEPEQLPAEKKQQKRESSSDTKKTMKVTEKVSQVPESNELIIPSNLNLKVPSTAEVSITPSVILDKFAKPLIVENENEVNETPKNPKLPKGVSWAQILSSNTIADCSINMNDILNPGNELDETTLFQLLEEKINNLQIDKSPSTILQLLASLQNEQNDDDDKTLVNPDDPMIDDLNSVNLKIQPHPSDINKKIILDDDDSSDEDDNDESIDHHHVRFAENIEVVNDDNNSTALSSDLDAMELSHTSTPNERLKFQQFKKQMLGTNKNYDIIEQHAKELKEKSDLLKTKLQEIEIEKANLMKIRNDLELDKIQLEHDRDDMAEHLKDERIKMEMELHDERLKLDQQKQKLDKMLRDSKMPSKKEREEIAKLKETIDELKDDMKTKEARHASAQARYRSQIKQLEKENQTIKLELEAFKKDNKKLEVENARLKRDTNNKMLQEINKNIAKLAQPEAIKVEVKKQDNVRRKSEPAKVAPIKKRVQSVPDLSSKSSDDSVSESEEEESIKNFNPLKSRMSDPVKKSTKNLSSPSDILSEMKREIVNADGSKDIWYPNGNLKKISADGLVIRMLYYNKDIKETNINEGTVKYYYADDNTWQTTYIDGLEILEYPNGQIEHRYKDGTIEVHYTNGSIRITNKNWKDDVKEEWRMPDGTNAKIFKNDTKIYSFANGQREIHTANHKRREYPDGTVKIMYEDGMMETRYSNGRIRVKDKDGNLISDNLDK